ncbi:CdaR family transcriptional regulator [Rhodococcus jostii]|uniref:CdaR family transcriptional regulator n=1 Tax=Rhodococcus jostii TaxID=132919 RepID=UPI00363746F9
MTVPTDGNGMADSSLVIGGELAQRIVDQVTPSLPYNVNIMDEHGRIIGSADRERVGAMHEGALEALRLRKVVRIRAGSDESGTKPGVNIPLVFDDQVIGVVGVTGEPVDVEPIADVLVLTVELLLRQEQQRDDSRWREAAIRDLISALMNGTVSETRLMAVLRDVGFPLRPPWNITAVIGTPSESVRSMPPASSVRLLRRLHGLPNVVTAEHRGALWILSGSSNAREVAAVLTRIRSTEVSFLIGNAEATTRELNLDAQRLRALLPRAGMLPTVNEIELRNLDTEIAVACQPQELTDDAIGRILKPLSSTLQHTATVFLSESMSISAACLALSVHRNTLIQRLNRIETLTALNLRTFDDAVTMRLTLLAALSRNAEYER